MNRVVANIISMRVEAEQVIEIKKQCIQTFLKHIDEEKEMIKEQVEIQKQANLIIERYCKDGGKL